MDGQKAMKAAGSSTADLAEVWALALIIRIGKDTSGKRTGL